MFVYTFLICLVGICFGLILIVLGNIFRNSGLLFGVFSMDKSTEEHKNLKEKFIPMLAILGNFLVIMGIILIMALVYFILFTFNIRS
jgi:hypothetical protein